MAATRTLRIGIATYEEIRARTVAIARGEHKPAPNEPKVWFTSMESLAQVLSTRNRVLLEIIAHSKPASVTELAALSHRQKSNVSRTLSTMARYGLVALLKDAEGRVVPRLTYDKLDLRWQFAP